MTVALGLNPAGHLQVLVGEDPEDALPPAVVRAVEAAFARGPAEGMLDLATRHHGRSLPPSLAYWREYACAYLTSLCRSPEGEAASGIPPPSAGDLEDWAGRAPPMQGLEYLRADVLGSLWTSLDSWVRKEQPREHSNGPTKVRREGRHSRPGDEADSFPLQGPHDRLGEYGGRRTPSRKRAETDAPAVTFELSTLEARPPSIGI